MLDSIHIENIAVAKNIDIDFSDKFNVITGETGAGKSIIIDAINFLLGARVSKEIIRYGETNVYVGAVFSGVGEEVYKICDDIGIEYDKDDAISVSRSFNIDGKNVIKINSRSVTLAQLKAISSKLIDIHSQGENQSFYDKNSQTALLDYYSDVSLEMEEYKELYFSLSSIKSQIAELKEMQKQRDMMVDILKFQIKEINDAKLSDIDEEEKLQTLRIKLRSSEKLSKLSMNVYKALLKNDSGVSSVVLIDKAIDSLEKLSEIEPGAKELVEKLTNFKYEITDIAESTRDFVVSDIQNPEIQLEKIEARISLIQKLERKYGPNIASVIEFKNNAEAKLKDFEFGDEKIEELTANYKKLYKKSTDIAKVIHDKRILGAKSLSKIVKTTLEFLDMPKVLFEITVTENKKDDHTILSQNGYDDVEFMIATNIGEELSPMNKIASGGELSRVMLDLKSAMSNKN